MKQIFFRSMLAILVLCGMATKMDAQSYYRCTSNNVDVRSGPGMKYAVVLCEYQGMSEPICISKGYVVKFLGKKQNGFMYVEDTNDWHWSSFDKGWVPAKFLTPAIKCKSCNGKGHLNKKCPECNGQGCSMMEGAECDDGYVRCKKCSGAGYR